ncbi:MAG: hypothetical protein ACK55I_05730, partial [bacterium]
RGRVRRVREGEDLPRVLHGRKSMSARHRDHFQTIMPLDLRECLLRDEGLRRLRRAFDARSGPLGRQGGGGSEEKKSTKHPT